MKQAFYSFALVLIVSNPSAKAEEESVVNQPLISRPVKMIASDDFNRAQLGEHWQVRGKGSAAILDGALAITSAGSKAENDIGSVRVKQPNAMNLGLAFRFKLGSAASGTLGIGGEGVGNVGKGSGWVVALRIYKNKLQLRADTGAIANEKIKIDPEKWYSGMLEVVGENVVVQIDGKKVIEGSNASIPRQTKNAINLQANKGTLYFDDIVSGEVRGK